MKKLLLSFTLFFLGQLLHSQNDNILFQEDFNSLPWKMTTSKSDTSSGTLFYADSALFKGDTGYSASNVVNIRDTSFLTTPIIHLNGYLQAIFRFDHICYIDQFDDAAVEYSFDGGLTWKRFPHEFDDNGIEREVYKGPSTYDFFGDFKFNKSSRPLEWRLLPVDDSAFVFQKNTTAWVTETFDLSPLLWRDTAASDSVQIRFALIDDPGSSPGRTGLHQWWIDNVRLFVPASIYGNVYFDENENVKLDSGEVGVGGVQIKLLPYNYLSTTNSKGEFNFTELGSGDYDVVIVPNNGIYNTSTSDTIKLNVEALDVHQVSFGISVIDTVNTSINTYTGRARCNGSVSYQVGIQNLGSPSINGIYYFIKDSLINFDNSTLLSSDSVKGDTIYFSYNDLPSFKKHKQIIRCTLPSIVVLPIGSTIESKVHSYVLDNNNQIIANSEKIDRDSAIVVCAYDPNDKQVNPVGTDSLGYIDSNTPLEYTIRFQNTGNDTAYKVVLIDTLSGDLDFSTFQFIDASHDAVSELKSHGELTFTFDNIFLVDSATNEPESNGYVQFKISPNKNLADSTTVANNAAIYFDFNPPIITNTVLSTFRDPLLVSLPELESKSNSLLIFPNPTSSSISIQLPQKAERATISLFNIQGKRVYHEEERNLRSFQISLEGFADGIYFITLNTEKEQQSAKVILQRN